MDNPYVTSNLVGANKVFIGRAGVLNCINRIISNPQNSALALYGQRRIGKTSLLQTLITHLPEQGSYIPVFFDLQGKTALSLTKVLTELASCLKQALALSHTLDEITPATFKEDFLPLVLSELPADACLVFLFDEFDSLSDSNNVQAGATFFPFLYETIAFYTPRIKSIFAAGRQPNDLSKLTPNVFEDLEICSISLLSADETTELVRLWEKDESLYWPDEVIDQIKALTAGHPLLTQRLCQIVWEQIYQNDSTESPLIQPQYVLLAIPTVLLDSAKDLEWMWRGLGANEQIVASILANTESEMISLDMLEKELADYELPDEALQDTIRLLREWDLVGDDYRFKVELLRRWVVECKSPGQIKDDYRHYLMAEKLFQVADDFYQEKNYQQAISMIRQLLDLNPYHLQANYLLAELLLDQGKAYEAQQILENVYCFQPGSTRPHLVKVLLQQAKNSVKNEERLTLYKQILQLEPNHPEAESEFQRIWIEYGDMALADNNLEKAVYAYQQAGMPDKVIDIVQQITKFEQEENYQSALALAQQLHQALPEGLESLPDLGWLEGRVGLHNLYQQALTAWDNDNPQTAEKLLAQVIAVEPRYKEAARYLHLVVTGVDVVELQTELKHEKNIREQIEVKAKETVDTNEKEIIKLQAQLEIERKKLEQLEIVIERGANFRNEHENQIKQLNNNLEAQTNARRQAEARLKTANIRTIGVGIFGIIAVLACIGSLFISGIAPFLTTATVVTSLPTSTASNSTPNPVPSTVAQELEIIGSINVTALKLRSQPNAEAEQVKILLANDPVIAIAQTTAGDWVLVRLPEDGSRGWLPSSDKYVEWLGDTGALPDETELSELSPKVVKIVGFVNITNLVLRSEPNTEAERLVLLFADDSVTAIAHNSTEDWILVQLEDGTQGWVPAADKYMEWVGDISSLPESE